MIAHSGLGISKKQKGEREMSARSPGKKLGQMKKRAARGLTAQGPAGGPGPLELVRARQTFAGAESHSGLELGRALPYGARLGVLGAPFGGVCGERAPSQGAGMRWQRRLCWNRSRRRGMVTGWHASTYYYSVLPAKLGSFIYQGGVGERRAHLMIRTRVLVRIESANGMKC